MKQSYILSINHNHPNFPTSLDLAYRHGSRSHFNMPIHSALQFLIAISCCVDKICFFLCFQPIIYHQFPVKELIVHRLLA